MDDEEKKARKERMKDYRRRYREKHGIVEKRRPWKKAIGAVAALCVLAFAGFFAAQSAAADRVTLDGQPVRDWTEEQARQYVEDKEGELKGRTIRLTGEDIDETIDFDDLELQFDKEKIFDDVYLVGRRGTPWQRLNDVVATLRFGKDVPLSLKVDEEKLDERVQQIHDVYDKAPENAYAVPNSDNKTVSIHKEKDRIVLDDAGLKQQIHDQLDRGVTEDMEAPIQSREEAAVKALTGEGSMDLQFINSLIPKRKANLENALGEVERLRRDLAEIEKAEQAASRELEMILSWAETFDAASRETQRSIIAMLIDRIVVYSDYRLDIHFRITVQQYLGKAS